jgi:hypothetical protein
MIIYEITTKVRLDLIEAFEKYMLDEHVADVLATGYFENAEMVCVTDGVYRMCYAVESRERLEKYFENDVKKLREDFNNRFPEGIEVSRQILEVLKNWDKA